MRKQTEKTIAIVATLVLIVIVFAIVLLRPNVSNDKYEVSFYSDTGELLAIEQVGEKETPVPPYIPNMQYGKIFEKWDTDFISVKSSLEVYPKTISFIGKANVFALPGVYGKHGNTVTVPLTLCGNVCLSGFDISVNYDSDVLKLESVFNEDGAIIYNTETEGVIYINYTSTENTVADVDICSLKFTIKKEVKQTKLSINVKSICANNNDETFYKPEYNVINSSVYALPNKGGAVYD